MLDGQGLGPARVTSVISGVASNALLKSVADDIAGHTTSSLFYSFAFLYMTPGVIQDAIKKVTKDPTTFVYGIWDKPVGGIALQTP